MKICWDNLEKYFIKYNKKTGNFRFWSGNQWKTIYYHETCKNCEEPFLSGKNQKFCCKSCSNSYTMKNSPERINQWIEQGKKTKLEKYGSLNCNNHIKASETKRNKSQKEKDETQRRKRETWLKNYDADHPMKNDQVKNKTKQTTLKNNGYECALGNEQMRFENVQKTLESLGYERNSNITNVFEIKEIQQRAENTIFNVYGVDSVLQLKEFRNDEKRAKSLKEAWRNKSDEELKQVSDQRKEIWSKKSDEEKQEIQEKKTETWKDKSDEEISNIVNKIIDTKRKNGSFGSISKISQIFFWRLYNLLTEEHKLKCNFHELNEEYRIFNYSVDFIVGNRIIEFYGDRWHANPKKFNENDVPPVYTKKKSKEIWEYDKNRNKIIENSGYKIFIVWASEVIKEESKILNDCLKFINKKEN